MTEQSEHLSSAQIESYGIRTSGAGPHAAQRDGHQRADHQSIDDQKMNDQSVEAHLGDCASCRNRLLDFHRSLFTHAADPPEADPPENDTSVTGHSPSRQTPADSTLLATGGKLESGRPTDSALANSNFANPKPPAGQQVRMAPTPECPSEDALRQLAAGLTPDDLAPALTRHAAICDHCGSLFRTFTEDFSDDFTPEEQAVLNNLQSSSAVWQRQTARQMLQPEKTRPLPVPSPEPVPQIFSWKWITAPAAVAAACVFLALGIGGVTWYAHRATPGKVDTLLAEAYTENRTMEMRIPYAKHSEFHQLRSGNGSLLSLPEAYRKAGDQITAQLKKNPDDLNWLLVSAQFDLLHWDYVSALKTLDQIEDANVKSSSQFLMNRALALYEQAEDQHQQEPYFEAADLLGKVLLNAPNDPVALFNHAIVCERIESWQCAESDWNRLLTVETDRAWANEARERLKQMKSKKKAAP